MNSCARGIRMVAIVVIVLLAAAAGFVMAADKDDGAAIYKAKCASCHGADGGASTPMGKSLKVRDLRLPEVQNKKDAELADWIAKGKKPMPAFDSLGAQKINAVVAYVRQLGGKKGK